MKASWENMMKASRLLLIGIGISIAFQGIAGETKTAQEKAQDDEKEEATARAELASKIARLDCATLNSEKISSAADDVIDARASLLLATKDTLQAERTKKQDAVKALINTETTGGAKPEVDTPKADTTTTTQAVDKAADAVVSRSKQVATLRILWDELGSYSKANRKAYITARQKLVDCAQREYNVALANVKVTDSLAKDSEKDLEAKSTSDLARADYTYIAQEQSFDKAQISIFSGPTLSLNGDDKFKTGFELSALYDGGAGSLGGYGRVFTDFIYQTKGSVDVADSEDGAVTAPNADQLFRKDKGILRFNAGISTELGETHRYSIFISGGLSTIPGVGGEFPQALRPRFALGLLGRDYVSEGLYTRLSLSVAHDEYWRQPSGMTAADTAIINSYERGVVEGLMVAPKLHASGVVMAARIRLDTPLDGKGPSEVKLSILASMDFNSFFGKFLQLGAAPAP